MIYVSAIVLAFNQEDTIKRTLDSIISQETNYPFEIIISDDDSSDNTRKVCEDFCRKYPQNTFLMDRHPNYGVVKNYSEALKRCSGKYIMVCAGDDWWHNPCKIELQVSFMENNPQVVLHYGGFINYYPTTGLSQFVAPYHVRGDVFETLLMRNFICAPTICIRNEAMKKIKFDRFVDLGFMVEDYPTYLALSNEGDFACTDEALVSYTTQYGSINNCSSFEKKKKYLDNVRVYKTFFARERGTGGKYIKIIENSYYYWLAEYAVRYGERKVAYNGYKQITDKNIKIIAKTILCSFGFTFNYLNKKFNANLK